MPITILRY